jgi:hypothetical protein
VVDKHASVKRRHISASQSQEARGRPRCSHEKDVIRRLVMEPFSRDHGGVSCRLTIMDELSDSDAAVRGRGSVQRQDNPGPLAFHFHFPLAASRPFNFRALLRGTRELQGWRLRPASPGMLPPSLPLHPSQRVPPHN